MLTDALKRLMQSESLSEADMAATIGALMDGEVSEVQIAGLLVALRLKGETIDEITGAARAMRERMTRIEVVHRPLIDTCGTGGDGAGTFNISTAVAFVVAEAGVAVAKHGNRAVSSRSGSADVLRELGVEIGADAKTVARCIDEVGLGFLFAPSCHPAMKYAAPVRKALGVRTIFNVLGPLTNPAAAPMQLMGVFDADLIEPLAQVLGRLGCQRAWVVHGDDGLDEITLCDTTRVAEWTGSDVVLHTIAPEDLGFTRGVAEDLRGGSPSDNASMMRQLLDGNSDGPLRDVVALNTAAALLIAGSVENLRAGVTMALEVLASGSCAKRLQRLVEVSHG